MLKLNLLRFQKTFRSASPLISVTPTSYNFILNITTLNYSTTAKNNNDKKDKKVDSNKKVDVPKGDKKTVIVKKETKENSPNASKKINDHNQKLNEKDDGININISSTEGGHLAPSVKTTLLIHKLPPSVTEKMSSLEGPTLKKGRNAHRSLALKSDIPLDHCITACIVFSNSLNAMLSQT